MSVDSHVHVVGDPERYPLRPTALAGDSWYRTSPVDAPGLATVMARAGVERAVLVQAVGAYSDDNSYVLDAAAADPDRFAAVVMVDAHGPDPRTALQQCIDRGAAGVRLFAVRDDEGSVDAAAYRPLWEGAAAQRIPVVVTIWPRQLAGVAAMAGAYPDLAVVIDHCAFPSFSNFPDGLGPILELAALPNISVKLTAHVLHDAAAAGERPDVVVATFVEAYGAHRVLWGSDFPQTPAASYQAVVEQARRATAKLPERDRALVLGANARRLWWPVRPAGPG
jgi:predicted TIM-barrel fold metal-dependent hydrolase